MENKDEKKTLGKKLEELIGGKGFYIVLSICLAVIGVSAYVLVAGSGYYVAESESDPVLSLPEETYVIAEPPTEEILLPEAAAELPFDEETALGEVGNWSGEPLEPAAEAQFVWPVDGIITEEYSIAALSYSEKFGDWRAHSAVELAAPAGTQVMSASAGVVESVENTALSGVTVTVAHAGGIRTVYGNLQELPAVTVGDNVMTGEIIGAVGSTAVGETREDPHLIFSMTVDGQAVDPAEYLPLR